MARYAVQSSLWGRYGDFATRKEAEAEARARRAEDRESGKIRSSVKVVKKSENPRRSTKAQRAAKARKPSVERRVSAAIKKFLQAKNPGRKITHARVKRNPGGSYTIIPIRIKKR